MMAALFVLGGFALFVLGVFVTGLDSGDRTPIE